MLNSKQTWLPVLQPCGCLDTDASLCYFGELCSLKKKKMKAIKRNTNLKTAVIRDLLFVFLSVRTHIVAACSSLRLQQSLYGTWNFKATGGAQAPHFKDGSDEMQQYLCNPHPGSLNASCSIHPAKVQLGEIRRHGARSCYRPPLKFVFPNVFYANLGTTIYSEDGVIIIQKPLSKSRCPLLGSVGWVRGDAPWSETFSLGSLLIPCRVRTRLTIDNLCLLPTKSF